MALTIQHAILHILSGTGADNYFSREELDIDSETCYTFIQKHVMRLLRNPGAKEATFRAESEVLALVGQYQGGDLYFRDFSVRLCERLGGIMERGKDIPSADILVAAFEYAGGRYIAILKLNYGECFTHRIIEDNDGAENQIVKNMLVLPFTSGRVEEACLIPYDPMILRILEKPYEVDGEMQDYFSKLFLECETELSKKETAEILHTIADEITAKFFDDDLEIATRMKCAVMDEAEYTPEDEGINLENVVKRVFAENEPVRTEFLGLAKDMGLPHELKMDKPFVRQQFKTQKFKAEGGIELKFPSELFQDPEVIQFQNNSDGTVSITLKNLRRC